MFLPWGVVIADGRKKQRLPSSSASMRDFLFRHIHDRVYMQGGASCSEETEAPVTARVALCFFLFASVSDPA